MKKPDAPTLSAHLLSEAKQFFGYPRRVYRTKANVEMHAKLHRLVAELLPWRSTFAPGDLSEAARYTAERGVLVDEIYCRELLEAIPDFVQRTGGLATLGLDDVPPGPPLVYLQEATRTYIAGFFRAAAALARAAVEAALRQRVGERFGSQGGDLEQVIEFCRRAKLISDAGHAAANRVRKAGNAVLYKVDAPLDGTAALAVVEDSRVVVHELLLKPEEGGR